MPGSDLLPKAQAANSAYSVMGSRLDVDLTRFGKAVWALMAQDAPLLRDLMLRAGLNTARIDALRDKLPVPCPKACHFNESLWRGPSSSDPPPVSRLLIRRRRQAGFMKG